MEEEVPQREQLRAELETVRTQSEDGILHPDRAEVWARANPHSALHASLQWDDTVAARLYRLQQIQQLIRATLIIPPQAPRQVRAYISMPSDRLHGGGYRRTEDAVALGLQELENEAIQSLLSFRLRYTHLPSLDRLFGAVELAVRRFQGEARGEAA